MDYKQPPRTDHLRRMTTNFGLIQHAIGSEPDQRFGYSIDDNARALIVCLDYAEIYKTDELSELEEIYFNFLARAFTQDGHFHNFYSIGEQPLDKKGSDDSYARTFWALAETAMRSRNKTVRDQAKLLWEKLDPTHHLAHKYLRTKCYILLGYCAMHDKEMAKIWADQLVSMFKDNQTEDWQWFEKSLTYCNAIPVYALASAAELTDQNEYRSIAELAFSWLDNVSRVDSIVAPIGQNGWYHHKKDKSIYDQQPVDAAKMVITAAELFELTKNLKYTKKAKEWMNWYNGSNTKKLSMIDPNSYGIYDGLTPTGVNKNQGAESIVTYLLAYLTLSTHSHEA